MKMFLILCKGCLELNVAILDHLTINRKKECPGERKLNNY